MSSGFLSLCLLACTCVQVVTFFVLAFVDSFVRYCPSVISFFLQVCIYMFRCFVLVQDFVDLRPFVNLSRYVYLVISYCISFTGDIVH